MSKKLITKINEFLDQNTDLTEDELLEMANITEEESGIDKVVLWIGPNPANHGLRIKVSNIPNRFEGKDCFTVTIPDLKVIGKINKSLINTEKLEDIKKFILLNIDIIKKYSNYEISTANFIKNIKSI